MQKNNNHNRNSEQRQQLSFEQRVQDIMSRYQVTEGEARSITEKLVAVEAQDQEELYQQIISNPKEVADDIEALTEYTKLDEELTEAQIRKHEERRQKVRDTIDTYDQMLKQEQERILLEMEAVDREREQLEKLAYIESVKQKTSKLEDEKQRHELVLEGKEEGENNINSNYNSSDRGGNDSYNG